jgi:hypothetical protein
MAHQKRNSQLNEKSGENNKGESNNAPERSDDSPGKHSESGYANDDYWEDAAREDSKESPVNAPEPENGYRWESTENKQSSDSEESDSDSDK